MTMKNFYVDQIVSCDVLNWFENKIIDNLFCRLTVDPDSEKCIENDGNLEPQIILFISQLLSGIGQTLCSALGISYLDDNVQKSKVPAIMSIIIKKSK